MATVNVYTDPFNGEGQSTTFLYQFQDKRFQELFFKQSFKSMSIGLSMGFNFSAIVPSLPKIPTGVVGKEQGSSETKSDFDMDLNFAQQKFKQQMKLRKDFLTVLEPVVMFSVDLKTGVKTFHNIKAEVEQAREQLGVEEK